MSTDPTEPNQTLEFVRQAFQQQLDAITRTAESVDAAWVDAAQYIAAAHSVVTTGLGKSGFIAKKMSATLNSLRIQSASMHPVDALHGDCGFLTPSDVLVAFSKSGETPELIGFAKHAKTIGLPVVAITARPESSLGALASVAVTIRVPAELDSNGIIPTASTTTMLVVADILSLLASKQRGGTVEDLLITHPQGAIGWSLHQRVQDVMRSGGQLPKVSLQATLTEALSELSGKGLGAVCIVGDEDRLEGIITDGDIRRFVASGKPVEQTRASEVMTSAPVTIQPEALLHEALVLMEQRERQIGVLPVTNGRICVGLIRIHDVVKMSQR